MNCLEVRANLEDYLTDESQSQASAVIRDHIWDCQECAIEAKRTRTLIHVVVDGLRTSETAPTGFADLVVARIGDRKGRRGLSTLSRSTIYILAVLGVTILFTAVVLEVRQYRYVAKGANQLSVPALSVEEIAKVSSSSSAESLSHRVVASSPNMVANALSTVTGFPVAAVDLSNLGANTVSGSTAVVAGSEAACTNYLWNGTKITLLQLASPVTLPTLKSLQFPTRNILFGGTATVRMAIWRSSDNVFVLTGNVPDQALIKMAESVPESTVSDAAMYDEHALN